MGVGVAGTVVGVAVPVGVEVVVGVEVAAEVAVGTAVGGAFTAKEALTVVHPEGALAVRVYGLLAGLGRLILQPKKGAVPNATLTWTPGAVAFSSLEQVSTAPPAPVPLVIFRVTTVELSLVSCVPDASWTETVGEGDIDCPAVPPVGCPPNASLVPAPWMDQAGRSLAAAAPGTGAMRPGAITKSTATARQKVAAAFFHGY